MNMLDRISRMVESGEHVTFSREGDGPAVCEVCNVHGEYIEAAGPSVTLALNSAFAQWESGKGPVTVELREGE